LHETPVISVVDDDAWSREGIRSLLQSLGYHAVAFASAEQFIKSDSVRCTACLITDLQMPGLSGFDLQRHLKNEGHQIPIIFVTAYPEERYRVRALAAGAICFLSKPFEEEALISCLRAVISE